MNSCRYCNAPATTFWLDPPPRYNCKSVPTDLCSMPASIGQHPCPASVVPPRLSGHTTACRPYPATATPHPTAGVTTGQQAPLPQVPLGSSCRRGSPAARHLCILPRTCRQPSQLRAKIDCKIKYLRQRRHLLSNSSLKGAAQSQDLSFLLPVRSYTHTATNEVLPLGPVLSSADET